MSFLSELKRRKVWQVAAAYAVVAWLLIQIVATVEEPLHLPEWFDTAVIVLLAIGFPIALILSWAFALTPQGMQRESAEPGQAVDDPGDGHRSERRRPAADETDGAAGQTLAEILASGPMPMAMLLRVAMQLADAMAAAHAGGVVYGDLTPARVVVGAGERVSILRCPPPESLHNENASAYLAPEQDGGQEATARSDQFAFGALLLEMAVRKPAFDAGRDGVGPVSAARLNERVPMPLEWFIQRCLARNPQDRFPSSELMRDELAAVVDSLKQAATGSNATPHNLPAQHTTLIGRSDELRRIRQLVTNENTRLVTLTGAGGIGKTRLLIELGKHALNDFAGGVYFVPLDRISDHQLVASEMMSALAVPRTPNLTSAVALRQHLHQTCVVPTLLLVDSFEHLLPAAPLLTDLLSTAGQLKIVVTSRAALRLYGEHEFQVLPLSMPDRKSADKADAVRESPAVRLFIDRAHWMEKTASGKVLDSEAIGQIADICERLDGVPLAIELAAARSRVLSLPALLENVRKPLEFLAGGPRDLPQRQQTLRATLDWSFNLLDANQQKLFRRLGVFVGGATFEAIEAVCNVRDDLGTEVMKATEALVENNLVQSEAQGQASPRFRMLETMREYALEQLADAGEEEHTQRAHAAYARVLAEECAVISTESHREALYQQFEAELGNLRAALDWLAATGNTEWGLTLACALGQYWQHRGRALEGYLRISRFLDADPSPDETELRAMALAWRGEFGMHCGKFDEAKTCYLESLAVSRRINHLPGILRALNGIAAVLCRTSSLDEAIPYLDEALEVARTAGGSTALIGSMLTNIANLVLQKGDPERAQQLHVEAARLFEKEGDQLALAWSINHQGDVARRRGDFEEALRLYSDALARFREQNERLGIAATLYDQAEIAASAGDHATAMDMNREALAMYCALDHRGDMPRVLDALAISAAQSDQANRALTLAGSAAALRKTCGLHLPEGRGSRLEESLDLARQQLSGPDATASWMAGWRMQPEQAIAYALAADGNAGTADA